MSFSPRVTQFFQATAGTLVLVVAWQIASYFFPHYLFPPVQDIVGRTIRILINWPELKQVLETAARIFAPILVRSKPYHSTAIKAAPKATHLFQYGVMGSIYAKKICNKEHPTIGLMNIGSESAKGHDLAKETYELFMDLIDDADGDVEAGSAGVIGGDDHGRRQLDVVGAHRCGCDQRQ